MNLKTNLLGGAMSAAAFIGIGKGILKPGAVAPPPAPRAEPKLPKPRAEGGVKDMLEDDDDAEDDDYCGDDGQDAPEDDDDDETKSEKRARRRQRKAKKLSDEAEEKKAAKKATKKDDDMEEDDSDAEMRGASPVAQARMRERARCAAIFGCEAAAGNIEMAAHLAFNTKMTRAEAIGALEAAPKTQSGGLLNAMAPHASQRAGLDAPQGGNIQAQTASTWDKLLSAAGSRRK